MVMLSEFLKDLKTFDEEKLEKIKVKLRENRLSKIKELGKGIRKEQIVSLIATGICATAVGAGMSGDGVDSWQGAVGATAKILTALTAGGFAVKCAWDVFKKSLELEKLAEKSEWGMTSFGASVPLEITPSKMKEINKKYAEQRRQNANSEIGK